MAGFASKCHYLSYFKNKFEYKQDWIFEKLTNRFRGWLRLYNFLLGDLRFSDIGGFGYLILQALIKALQFFFQVCYACVRLPSFHQNVNMFYLKNSQNPSARGLGLTTFLLSVWWFCLMAGFASKCHYFRYFKNKFEYLKNWQIASGAG